MLKKERARFAQKVLNRLYKSTPVPLDHSDHYTLLIAVLLSAQCTDIRVNQVTPALFKLASNPIDMAKKTTEQLYPIIKPCGLAPKKSRAIIELSKKTSLVVMDEAHLSTAKTYKTIIELLMLFKDLG